MEKQLHRMRFTPGPMKHKTIPKTSAPSLAETIELFRPYVEEGREIVCFSISNSMSTSGNVMRLAAGN